MSDIRKRDGNKGVTYQVRYPSAGTRTGYAYKTFRTMKEARAFRDKNAANPVSALLDTTIRTVGQAIDRWLDICEKEGRDGRDPVTAYTLGTYRRRADIMKAYPWEKALADLQTPDVVAFRSWLLRTHSRDLARKTLTSFHAVIKEMAMRGHIASNVAASVAIRAESRYDEPIVIPTPEEVARLLAAADRLANSRNKQTARTWRRYRPILYLAADSGMRPQEYLVIAKSGLHDGGVQVTRALERGGGKLSVTKTPAGRRFIDLSPETYDMVRHYAEHHAADNPHDLVFATETGKWLDTDNWRKRGFYKACIEAGLVDEDTDEDGKAILVPRFSPYDLRHFYASMLIEQRVNFKRMQKLMGHEDVKTTLNVYGHLIEKAERASEERFGMLSRLPRNTCGESVASAP
ncbi:Site-specific recombinase XerD [Rhodospira trueperi]|uniref:Site-specific recombinase XerD n=2 Tax=Rhodospira trueperi TaxID=69960 RepID=A0A1G7HHU5_9PROT|nr:Site-specific recombinase XerD [Rhodospira trueperi]